MKIGFFGGCFNPPSNIHINLAKNVMNEFKLNKVFFVPVGDYYKKTELIPAEHRFSMLKLAIEKEKNIEVERLAIDSKNVLYASDTFKLIKGKYINDEIFFIMGSDNFREMPNWKDYEELVNNYNIIVIERERKHIRKTNSKNIFEIIPKQLEVIDSSKIRKMINEDIDISPYINKKVYNYIRENKLYKKGE